MKQAPQLLLGLLSVVVDRMTVAFSGGVVGELSVLLQQAHLFWARLRTTLELFATLVDNTSLPAVRFEAYLGRSMGFDRAVVVDNHSLVAVLVNRRLMFDNVAFLRVRSTAAVAATVERVSEDR